MAEPATRPPGLDGWALFDASPHPSIVLGRDLTILACNDAYLSLVPRRREDLVGRYLYEAFPGDPDDPDDPTVRRSRAALERVLREGVSETLALLPYATPRATPEGERVETRYWSITLTPLFDARGEVAFILAHPVDVTELQHLDDRTDQPDPSPAGRIAASIFHRAEAVHRVNRDLEAERGRLRHLFEQSPGIVAILRGPDHVFEVVNAAYNELIGHREVIGKPVREALPEIEGQGYFELLDQVYRTGEPYAAREARVLVRRRPDGPLEEIYVDFVYQPIVEPDGAVSGIFAQGTDVTARKRAQEALSASEVRLRAVFDNASVAIFLMDDRQHCVYMNRAAERMTGFTLDEVLSLDRPLHDIIHHTHPDGRPFPLEECAIDRALPTNSREQGEEVFVHRDGRFYPVAFTASPIRDEAANIVGTVIEVRDISEQKRAQEALRLSEDRYRTVFERSYDAIFLLDPENNAVLDANPAAVAMFGYSSREELLATPLSEFHPSDLPAFLAFVRAVHAEGVGWTNEFACRAKDGRFLDSEISASSLLIDGRPHLLALVRDVAERRRTEQALRDSEARLRATYENVQVGICEVDLTGRFLAVNEMFCRIVGYSRDEVLHLTVSDITHPDDVAPSVENLRRLRAGEIDVMRLDKRYVRKDGQTVWGNLSATMIRDPDGRPAYVVAALQDITGRKLAEERQRLLMNELNHRVKNTLATVQAVAAQSFKSVQETEALARFNARLLALSQAHNVLAEESWTSAGLKAVLAHTLAPFSGAENSRIVATGPDLPLNPKFAVTFAMVLHELATNAAKYGALSAEGGRVHIAWEVTGGADARLRLTWEENGGPAVTPPTRRGFGSRLIERQFAREFGGEVRLEFRPAGVVCTVDVPRAEASWTRRGSTDVDASPSRATEQAVGS